MVFGKRKKPEDVKTEIQDAEIKPNKEVTMEDLTTMSADEIKKWQDDQLKKGEIIKGDPDEHDHIKITDDDWILRLVKATEEIRDLLKDLHFIEIKKSSMISVANQEVKK